MCLLLSLLVLLIILYCPFDFTISPERKFKVVDGTGMTISAAVVKQTWYQYSLKFREEEKINISSDGVVVIPQRKVNTRWIDLLSGAAGKIVEYTIHASIGSSDTLIINALGYESKWFFDGERLEKTVVLKRQ